LFKTAAQDAVKTSAEEGAKMAIRELEWPKEFARELQKSRGLERQELRFRSYEKAALDLFTRLSDAGSARHYLQAPG
jgi:hypothetical protein